jgi:hypothetical protein
MLPGSGDQGSLGRQLSFSPAQGLLVERSRTQVPVDAACTNEAKCFEAMRPLYLNGHTDVILKVSMWWRIGVAKDRIVPAQSEPSQPVIGGNRNPGYIVDGAG